MLTHVHFIKTKCNSKTTHLFLKCSPGVLVNPFNWSSNFVILVLVQEISLDNSEEYIAGLVDWTAVEEVPKSM